MTSLPRGLWAVLSKAGFLYYFHCLQDNVTQLSVGLSCLQLKSLYILTFAVFTQVFYFSFGIAFNLFCKNFMWLLFPLANYFLKGNSSMFCQMFIFKTKVRIHCPYSRFIDFFLSIIKVAWEVYIWGYSYDSLVRVSNGRWCKAFTFLLNSLIGNLLQKLYSSS